MHILFQELLDISKRNSKLSSAQLLYSIQFSAQLNDLKIVVCLMSNISTATAQLQEESFLVLLAKTIVTVTTYIAR